MSKMQMVAVGIVGWIIVHLGLVLLGAVFGGSAVHLWGS